MSAGSLDTYVVEPRVVTAGGKPVQVSPLKMRAIPPFTRAISPALGPLLAGDLLTAVGVGGESLISAVAIATGEPEEWVGDLLPDAFLALLAAVVEVNTDFFAQRVTPAVEAVTARLTALASTTPSPLSAPTVTG